MTEKPKMPARLGAQGKALWSAMVGTYEFDPAELTILSAACRQADDVAALEAIIAKGMVVAGSKGQPRLAAAVTEARQGRLALARLLEQLRLPADDEQVGMTPASRRAQRAAMYRWRARENEAG